MDRQDEILCYCIRLTHSQVEPVARQCLDFNQVVRITGACTGCGSCQFELEELLDKLKAEQGLVG
ncbi:(2Fe-2S)-binding protein [Anthocerotibacter panamensis]|uniref:(2Fe-2S)-binding protein n=1 Tax=Anthocerotibacter panamensis TaxID=2857077 RepID=UPI001C4023AE|nr:(2Fe-2S)-binding protein [Anthocerotibacter panamensis]